MPNQTRCKKCNKVIEDNEELCSGCRNPKRPMQEYIDPKVQAYDSVRFQHEHKKMMEEFQENEFRQPPSNSDL